MVTVTPTAEICGNKNGTAQASITSGGNAPFTYTWNTTPNQTTATASGLTKGNYSVIITDANGCSQTTTVLVTETPGPTATTSGNISIMKGATATLSASGGGSYSWSNGSAKDTILVKPIVTTQYCVVVKDANNCTDLSCLTVVIEKDPCTVTPDLVYVPNAFSPNEDGDNDFLTVYYPDKRCIKNIYFIIYDRWGEKVFFAEDANASWDGKYNDKIMNPAVYAYYLKVIFIDDTQLEKKGNISLLK